MKGIHLIIGLFLFTVFGCTSENPVSNSNNENLTQLEGTLFFKLIDLPNLYSFPEEKCEELLASFRDSRLKNDTDSTDVISIYWNKLKEHNLLLKPTFKLQNDSIEFINVFLEEDQYGQIKDFELSELRAEKKKVNITLAGELLDHNIVNCTEIVSVEKVDGETPTKK